jgi:acetyl esterase/lipase
VTAHRIAAALAACALMALPAFAAEKTPEKLLLWPAGAPGADANGGEETVRVTEQGDHVVSNVHKPSLTVYLPKGPAKAARPAVLIIPGGGHRELWTDHEGHTIARFLNEQGIAAFVLYYRLERAPNSIYKVKEHALTDLHQAMSLVRSRAVEWNIDPARLGTMGFSAGGQLALFGALDFDKTTRPDFVALVYPGNVDGIKFDANTPPMYLLSGSDDRPGVIATLTQVFTQLREAKVPAEMHFYDGVPHGFGMRASNSGPVANWPHEFVDWLRVRKILLGD